MPDNLRPDVLGLSPSSVETWRRCRREFRNAHLLNIPGSDGGPSPDQGLLVHDLLRHLHRNGSCRDGTYVDEVLVAHGLPASSPVRGYVERHLRRCPPDFEDARHELELARFHRRPAPMFMATGRIDAVWVHDGLLDARDYKTGRVELDRVGDDPRARVQAWLLAPAAARRGLRLRVSYECLAAETVDDPRPYEPDADELDTIEEELRGVAEAIWGEGAFAGVADVEICGSCRYRSICTDSAAPADPVWPMVEDDVQIEAVPADR
jgi:PD-(D/E)XK nuclease superfamily